MALKVAERGRIPSFIVMDVLRAANEKMAAGEHVLHLEVGQPGTPAPEAVRKAAHNALDSLRLGYTDALGIPRLRKRIARHYMETYGTEVDPDRIAVTAGSSAGFLLSFLAAFEPGDRVALAAPGYPAYRNILKALGLEAVLLPTGPEERFQPTPELIEQAGELDGLILASPSNPTGTMVDKETLGRIVDCCRERGIRLVSDEIYHGIEFTRRAVSASELDDEAIIVNSFSKYYSMTGWRLGWLVLPPELVRPIECLAQNLFISPMALSQEAGVAAFDASKELDGIVQVYAQNRAHLLEHLPNSGFPDLAPADGAFYIYAYSGHLGDDSQALCKRMLDEVNVAATPGNDFDPERGHHYIRFSFAGAHEDIVEACERLKGWTATL
ncbi:MAG: pyridoxal phosphate-dependent aminotransferase [Pseudomonadota bacterium]